MLLDHLCPVFRFQLVDPQMSSSYNKHKPPSLPKHVAQHRHKRMTTWCLNMFTLNSWPKSKVLASKTYQPTSSQPRPWRFVASLWKVLLWMTWSVGSTSRRRWEWDHWTTVKCIAWSSEHDKLFWMRHFYIWHKLIQTDTISFWDFKLVEVDHCPGIGGSSASRSEQRISPGKHDGFSGQHHERGWVLATDEWQSKCGRNRRPSEKSKSLPTRRKWLSTQRLRADMTTGAAVSEAARRRRTHAYPEFAQSARCRLAVFGLGMLGHGSRPPTPTLAHTLTEHRWETPIAPSRLPLSIPPHWNTCHAKRVRRRSAQGIVGKKKCYQLIFLKLDPAVFFRDLVQFSPPFVQAKGEMGTLDLPMFVALFNQVTDMLAKEELGFQWGRALSKYVWCWCCIPGLILVKGNFLAETCTVPGISLDCKK